MTKNVSVAMFLVFLGLCRAAGESATPTPWPTSRSGVPPTWLTVLVCLGSFVVLCVLVLTWSLMKHPETERIAQSYEPFVQD